MAKKPAQKIIKGAGPQISKPISQSPTIGCHVEGDLELGSRSSLDIAGPPPCTRPLVTDETVMRFIVRGGPVRDAHY